MIHKVYRYFLELKNSDYKNLKLNLPKNIIIELDNKKDFNKYPIPALHTKNKEKFKIEISPYDIERYEYHMKMEREDKYIETLENSSQSSSNSEYDYE